MHLSHRQSADPGAATEARALGVDTVLYVDLPMWWCRLTAPVALSWRRQAAVLVALPLAGFALGVVAGARLLG